MDNYKFNEENIENRGWQQLAQPQYAEKDQPPIVNDNGDVAKKHKKHFSHSPVLTFQLILCFIALSLLYFSKTFLPSAFNFFMDTYNREINTSMYFSGDFRDLDFSDLFIATNDEA